MRDPTSTSDIDEKLGFLVTDIESAATAFSADQRNSKTRCMTLSWDEEAALTNIAALEKRMTGLER